MTTLTFRNAVINTTIRQNQIWLTSAELAKALDYKSEKSITNLFNANSD